MHREYFCHFFVSENNNWNLFLLSFYVFLFKLQFTNCLIDIHVGLFSKFSFTEFLILGLAFQTTKYIVHSSCQDMIEEKNLLLTDVLFCTTDARFVYPIIDRFSLQLISPVSWEIIPSTRLVLGCYHILY